jgi:hypothetical protein
MRALQGGVAVSIYEYRAAMHIEDQGYPFYALIQAAMRKADSDNLEKLKEAFPEVWKEFLERYNNSGGLSNAEMSR